MKSYNLSAVSLQAILEAIALLLLGWALSRLARYLLDKLLPEKLSTHQQVLIQKSSFYFIISLFFFLALKQLGISASVLLGAAGIFSVAIGFASQTSASNLISGIFLLAERPFSVGDVIQLGATVGEVIAIDLLSIKLRTPTNLMVRIPNETIIKSEVTTLTRFHIRRLDLNLSVAYKENLAQIKKILFKVSEDYPFALAEPEPTFTVLDFAEASVNLQLSVWCSRENFTKASSDLLEHIKAAFEQAHIETPCQQISLHTDHNHGLPPMANLTEGNIPLSQS